ncbi:MAG TPA: DUF4347 domain-containing protein, partial [Gammaproteobacteria bacterium]|nr:DUF4347 domain-containing protein [Gammaproteobacteria bacterium]
MAGRDMAKKDDKDKKYKTRPELEAVEPRLLFSAGLEGVLAATQLETPPDDYQQTVIEQTLDQGSLQSTEASIADARLELIFVDTDVPEYQTLLSDLLTYPDETTRYEVFELDNTQDGLAQISAILSGFDDVNAVHILSHGEAGAIDLGGSMLDGDALAANADLVRSWGGALTDSADIMIYGCNLAGSAEGQLLVNSLATLTGADVAASDDLTGNAQLGGDWELEYRSGQVETAVFAGVAVLEDWAATLDVAEVSAEYLETPLAFEENTGQTDETVDFLSRGDGYSVFLTDGDAVLVLSGSETQQAVRLDLVGANEDLVVSGQDELASSSNYLLGDDAANWQTDVDNFASVHYENVYDGIDLRYYGSQRQLEYDFVVGPGSDPDAIRLNFDGVLNAEITATGELHLILNEQGDEIFFKAPISYQTADDGTRIEVESAYVINDDGTIGFTLGDYDTSRELVIDPILDYTTFLGGTGYDTVEGVAADSAGNVYITGWTGSTDFPTSVGALDQSYGGGSYDMYVAKLSPDGSTLLYSTFIGGTGNDTANAIEVDASGNVYVVGSSSSTDIATVNAYQTSLTGTSSAYLFKLNSTGDTLLYASYIGGTGSETGYDLALDGAGRVHIAGSTTSADLPLQNAYDSTLGGTQDAFLATFDLSQSGAGSLVYSSYFGGSGSEDIRSLAVDPNGNIVVVGLTTSTDLSTVNGYQTTLGGGNDAFVARFSSDGSTLLYATYLGGSSTDYAEAVAVDGSGNIYVGGRTDGVFATTAGAFDTSYGASADGFVTKIDPTKSGAASLVYS